MVIRNSMEKDIPQIMEIYEHARHFMAEHGNPNQWGPTNWPPKALIHSDITNGNSYVCICDDKIVGTFFFQYGKDIEPAYSTIKDGAWLDNSVYGVIHRLAGDGTVKGIGKFCMDWAFEKCGHLRVDTHEDNQVMQNIFAKSGFTYCGIIYVAEDNHPRLAYEKLRHVVL